MRLIVVLLILDIELLESHSAFVPTHHGKSFGKAKIKRTSVNKWNEQAGRWFAHEAVAQPQFFPDRRHFSEIFKARSNKFWNFFLSNFSVEVLTNYLFYSIYTSREVEIFIYHRKFTVSFWKTEGTYSVFPLLLQSFIWSINEQLGL